MQFDLPINRAKSELIIEGKLADIVAMPESPLDDMSNIEQVNFVMKGGQVVRND